MESNSNFLITTEAVCKILQVCPRTLYNIIECNEMFSHKLRL
jgi:hypothetical protein